MNSVICPSILAETEAEYAQQIKKVAKLTKRIQIDLMDGQFASSKSIDLKKVWWPHGVKADLHLMYMTPEKYIEDVILLNPHMAIIHAEVKVDHMYLAAQLHKEGIKAGLAVLPETTIDQVEQIIHSFDHLLIFSGDLGHFGGHANLDLISKVKQAKKDHPYLEIGWDGGVNPENIKQLAEAGVDVLSVGGFMQNSEDPMKAYKLLEDSI